MEENKSLWNKTTAEITVRDQVVMSAVIITVMAAPMVILSVGVSVRDKIQKIKKNRQENKPNES